MVAKSQPAAEQLREGFKAQGYTLVRGFLEPDIIAGARAEMMRLVEREAEKLLAAGKIDQPYADAPFETRLAQLYAAHADEAPKVYRRELHLAGLFPVFFHPGLLDIAELFLGGEIRLYPNYSARPKLPDNARTEVLWHQDGGYTSGEVEMLRMLNVWTPLVPATVENGCMQFIPGTHRLGAVPHERRTHYLEIAKDYLEPRLSQAVDIELDPGDVVLFHNLLFHRGQPNHAQTIRWSLDWRYQDASQPTMRVGNGHMARSRATPERVVRTAEEWASLTFC